MQDAKLLDTMDGSVSKNTAARSNRVDMQYLGNVQYPEQFLHENMAGSNADSANL